VPVPGRFFIYFPAGGVIHVVHANHPAGPWSEPVSLGIHLYDPAHIAEGGLWGHTEKGTTRATFRIVNDRQEVDFYYRLPGQPWKKTDTSTEISGMNHNVLGSFLDVRPALFACGTGSATFRSFCYWPRAMAPI